MSLQQNDYGELFCEAVDTIVKQRLQGVSYDSTILCTIVDDEKREQGIYTVSDGSSKFQAYSTITSYRKNNNVYVQIPQGDWNAQKFILGKKIENEAKEDGIIYKSPFSQLVDVTGNLIKVEIPSNLTGLIANYPNKESIVLWSYNLPEEQSLFSQSGINFLGYTRLGIQGSFQSLLNPFLKTVNGKQEYFNVSKGNYGLRLRISAIDDITQTQIEKEEIEEQVSVYELELNSNDMNGDPFNFSSFFQQEKVFDISDFKEIKSIALEFYQEPGSFTDATGEHIKPYNSGNDIFENLENPNLFVQDIYITLGYDINDFKDELVTIYSLDSSTYLRDKKPEQANYKKLQLRWIHKDSQGNFKSILEKDKMDFELRWYRYSFGEQSADKYSGVYWKRLSTQRWDKEQHKYIYETHDKDLINLDLYKEEFFNSLLIPDTSLKEEKIKAIIIYNDNVYKSNILTFTNESNADLSTVDTLTALTIGCEDGTDGNYRIYSQGGFLLNESESKKKREFQLYFDSLLNDNNKNDNDGGKKLTEALSIIWRIPRENTMIRLNADNIENQEYTEINSKTGYYEIVRTYNAGTASQAFTKLPYYISSFWSESYSNNTVYCTVVRNKGNIYTATKTLTFGAAGTTGTDCTLVIDFKDSSLQAIDVTSNKITTFEANLYDANNKNITQDVIKKECRFNWGWKVNTAGVGGTSNLSVSLDRTDPLDENKKLKANEVNIEHTVQTNLSDNYWNILQCTVEGWGDHDLVAYLPIPLKVSNKEYNPLFIDGASRIVYSTEGIPTYYRNPYFLHYEKTEEELESDINPSLNWDTNIKDNQFYPKINNTDENKYNKNSLQALNFYIKDCADGLVVNCSYNNDILWSQPILIIQNIHFSNTINKWDGNLNVGVTDPGTIMSPRLAAGKKDDNGNTFSGVILGDWQEKSDTDGILLTGVYGFSGGEMSYAFKEDGTAFIGKSGKGRIVFNGDDSTIKDASGNMTIDLDDGLIDSKNFMLQAGTSPNTITITSRQGSNPLSIGPNNFFVEWNGTLHATNGNFNGTITGSTITGSTINNGNGTFSVTSDGKLTATSATITGDIQSGSTITGSTITGGSIYVPNQNSPTFSVNGNGILTATGATINGDSTFNGTITSQSGTIGGWIIGTNTLKDNSESVILNSSDGSITGATIKAGTLSSSSASDRINLDGYLTIPTVSDSFFGYTVSDHGTEDPYSKKPGIGMGIGPSCIKVSETTIGITTGGSAATNYIVFNKDIDELSQAGGILAYSYQKIELKADYGVILDATHQGSVELYGNTLSMRNKTSTKTQGTEVFNMDNSGNINIFSALNIKSSSGTAAIKMTGTNFTIADEVKIEGVYAVLA